MTVIVTPTPALHNAFQPSKSGDPMMNVFCQCDHEKVTLSGTVSRFYHVQLAIEAARKLAEGRQIDVRIEVITPPVPSARADWHVDSHTAGHVEEKPL